MLNIVYSSWALFTGFGFIMLAHSLQGTLLNINAVLFNFSDFEIGYVFTGYFMGYLASSYIFSGLKNLLPLNIVLSGENVIFVLDLILFSPTFMSLPSGMPFEKL